MKIEIQSLEKTTKSLILQDGQIIINMPENFLNSAYNTQQFRESGHQIVNLLSDYLEKIMHNENEPVMKWAEPDDQYKNWKNYPFEKKDLRTFYADLIEGSIHLHHPKYMGHQVSAPLPVTAIAGMVSSLLNNGMAIYEMGPVATALEKWIVEQFCERLGFGKKSDGLLTSGGTLSTLTALLTARQVKVKDNVWKNGSPKNLAILIPEQAHYAVDRAARIMGFGDDDIIKIPVDEGFRLRTDLLPGYLKKAQQDGKQVIAVTANACSTATGVYDDLQAVGDFCQANNLWFHVDAAHGGGVIFSENHKTLLNGVERADSVIIDLHKMLMNPALATMLLFKNGMDSYRTFNQDAHYLWEKNEDPEWFNYAKRTFECTKLMMSIKFYSILVEYGFGIFDENINTLYTLASEFAEMIKKRPVFELAVKPMSNIVCFRLLDKKMDETLNQLNSRIRKSILEKGDFYIVQTELKGQVYLRTTLMNPFTTKKHLIELLDTIEKVGQTIPD